MTVPFRLQKHEADLLSGTLNGGRGAGRCGRLGPLGTGFPSKQPYLLPVPSMPEAGVAGSLVWREGSEELGGDPVPSRLLIP